MRTMDNIRGDIAQRSLIIGYTKQNIIRMNNYLKDLNKRQRKDARLLNKMKKEEEKK